jgi:hypothetical protein
MTWPPPVFSELDGLAVFMAWFLPAPLLRTFCYMITGGRPGRADAAQRLPEKTLQRRRAWQPGRDLLFYSPGVRPCLPTDSPEALGCFVPG